MSQTAGSALVRGGSSSHPAIGVGTSPARHDRAMAFRRPDETRDDAVAEMFERARNSKKGSSPRKHHLVPASYLERWAPSGQVRVTGSSGMTGDPRLTVAD